MGYIPQGGICNILKNGGPMPNRIIQYPVPLILKKILKDKPTGELVVVGKNFSKSLYFINGVLTFAKTTSLEERLGEILFKLGKINREQYLDINRLIKEHSERLGKILVSKNMLSQRDLFFALIYQLRTIATSTFELVSGEWNFIEKLPEIPEDSKFSVELPGIITEGTNKMANLAYFKNKFYYKSPRLTPVPRHIHEVLSNHELSFHKELNQFNNVNNQQIIEAMKVSEDLFWRKISMFYLLGLVEFGEVSVDLERDKNIEDILLLFEQLKADRMDYYQLLGIKNIATFNEIKGAYFEFAKRYHPDRISSAPDPEIKDKANFVFAEINKAYETLSNVDKKNEYDSKGYKEMGGPDSVQENLGEKAKLLYRRAKALYTQKKFWEAASIMDEAVALDTKKASYFLLLGLSQVNMPALRRMAAANLQKAIDLEPWNVEAYTALGILFLTEGQAKRAEGFFRKTLSINPDHALARKKLTEITGKDPKKKGKRSFFGRGKK
jgi:curved DNA-binding protein CbpA